MTDYLGHDPKEYKRLRAEIDKLFLEWWKCHDNKQAKIIFDDYLDAIHAASAVAPPVARVWKMEMEELK